MLFMRRSLRKLKANRRGSVVFEFALVAPLLFTLILGGLEYSFIMFSYGSMQLGADLAARSISVNTAVAGNATTLVKSKVPAWFAPAVTVNVTQSNLADPRKNIIRVSATADAQNATPIALFSKAIPWTLTTEVATVQELPF